MSERELRAESKEKSEKSSTKTEREGFVGEARPSAQRRTLGQSSPCVDCGAVDWNLDEHRGEVYCASCGYVAEENVIDEGPDWINYGNGADKSRVGAPSTFALADKGLNTNIDRKDLLSGQASRLGIKGKSRRDWRRRAVIDQRAKTRDSRIRNLTKAMQLIRDCSDLQGNLVEEAAFYYRKACEKGLVVGRSIAGVSAACVYLAAREAKLPRSIPELASAFDVREKELKRIIRHASRVLGVHHITGPEEYLDLFHSKLQLPPEVSKEANYMWSRVKQLDIWQGKKPSGIAGTLLYEAAKIRGATRTQAEICEIAGVSEVTLRGLLKLLKQALRDVGEGLEN